MSEKLARYACDTCKVRKIACSRVLAGCRRCTDQDLVCTYSRSGVLRRKRKLKHEASANNQAHDGGPGVNNAGHGETDESAVQSHLASDIAATREQLSGQETLQHNPLGALSALSKACAAVWEDSSELDKFGKTFFLFEDRADSWVDVFVDTLNKGRPLLSPAPPGVLNDLRASRPYQVNEKAWLVMYYSIILVHVSSTGPNDETTKAKLRCNLWLALNDARLFLEPSESNIQALVMLACHAEEFITPSVSWILVSNACRMLQALGVKSRRVDSQTRGGRVLMFWHLSILDKGFALIFGRPPTFHRAMAREIALPPLEQLLPFQPHNTAGAPGLFGAHYMYQQFSVCPIMADIWHCLHEETVPDSVYVDVVNQDLQSWYRQARELLEAAAKVEKPFLDPKSAASIDLGLQSLKFTYHYLVILLCKTSSSMKEQCLKSSKEMLLVLDGMVSGSEEVYNGIVWHLLCAPFTPFLALFSELLSNKHGTSEDNTEAIAAMKQLPIFLAKMSPRSSLAVKLERVATVLVQHAESLICPRGAQPGAEVPNLSDPNLETFPDAWLSTGQALDWNSLFSNLMTTSTLDFPQSDSLGAQPNDLAPQSADLFGDAFVDWIGLDSQY